MTACPGLVNPTSSPLLLITFSFLYLFLYASSCSQHKIRNTIQLIMIHWSVYSWHWLLDCPKIYLSNCPLKQSLSSTRSYAETVSAACSTSHWSKFNTSQTWSVRGRVSTTQRPWLIERFLWRMFATSYWLTLSAWWTTSHNLVYDSSIPARTGWISTPPTRCTITLSFNWEMVRMIVSWTRESFRWDTALAGTHRKGDKFLRKCHGFVVCDYFTHDSSFPFYPGWPSLTFYWTITPFPFYPGSIWPFLLFYIPVPSTPSLTTLTTHDRVCTCNSQPQHSQGYEACLSPSIVIHSLFPLQPQSRLTCDWLTPSGIPSHMCTLVSPTVILSWDSTDRYSHITDLVGSPPDLQISLVTLGPSFLGFSHCLDPFVLPWIIFGSIWLIPDIGDRIFLRDTSYRYWRPTATPTSRLCWHLHGPLIFNNPPI